MASSCPSEKSIQVQRVTKVHLTTMSLSKDKIQHFCVCFAMTILFFCWKRFGSGFPWKLATIWAMIVTFGVGLLKELADYASNRWPWCSPTCQADAMDIAANALGIVVAGFSIWVLMNLLPNATRRSCHTKSFSSTRPEREASTFNSTSWQNVPNSHFLLLLQRHCCS